jgi:hypothetical protein
MIPIYEALSEFKAAEGEVRLGDNNVKLHILGKGNTPLLSQLLLVDGLSFGLISIGRLDRDGNISIFDDGRVFVYDYCGDELLTGTLRNNLYHLDDHYRNILLANCYPTHDDISTTYNDNSDDVNGNSSEYVYRASTVPISHRHRPIGATLGFNILEHIHNRLAHIPEHALKRMIRLKCIAGSGATYDEIKHLHIRFCEECYKGKMRAFSRETSISTIIWGILEYVGIDWKAFKVLSDRGHTGFYLLADRRSNYLASYPCKSQSEVQECLEDFVINIVEASGHKMNILQSDSTSNIINKSVHKWLISRGIMLRLSAPYVHSQNGMVEKDMHFVVDTARTCMSVYNTPPKFWNYAIQYAVHTINHTHLTGDATKTPYELVYNIVPDVSHFVPFYAPGVCHVPVEERKVKSWAWKAMPCRMLGYSTTSKHTYIVLNAHTSMGIKERRDCIFNENLYEVIKEAQRHPEVKLNIYKLFKAFTRFNVPTDDIPDSDKMYVDDDNLYWHRNSKSDVNNVHKPDITDNDRVVNSDVSDHTVYAEFIEDWCTDTACSMLQIPKLPDTPNSVKEALAGEYGGEWWDAIKKELDSMTSIGAMKIAKEQFGRGMKMKMLLKPKYDNDFNVVFKARLVVCGYSQVYLRDYGETFAPTIPVNIVFLVLHLVAHSGCYVATFDVGSAFLQPYNDYINFAYLPEGIFKDRKRVEVVKSVYGEKQAAMLWYKMFDDILVRFMGFSRCPVAPCLYIRKNEHGTIISTIFVDDGTLCCSSEDLIDTFMTEIRKHLPKVTVVKHIHKYIGIKTDYDRNSNHIELSHPVYIDEKFKDDSSNVENIPMCPSYNLRKELPNPANASLLHITGKLRFLCDRSRWDILCATGEISTGGDKNPSDAHVRTAHKIIGYLKSTPDRVLRVGGSDKPILFGFCDASYRPEGKSKSRLGGCLFLGLDSGAFFSFSKNGSLVATSSTHAELQALDELVRYILHTRQILEFLGYIQVTTKIYLDSSSSIDLCTMLKVTHKTSPINMRVNFIRECIDLSYITLIFVPTDLNVADVLTKPLALDKFEKHSNRLMRGFGGIDVCTYIDTATITIATLSDLDQFQD